jgi:hypothetical protein
MGYTNTSKEGSSEKNISLVNNWFRWSLADILDYEILLSGDEGVNEDTLHKRDREIYLSIPKTHLDNRKIVRFWFDNRIEEEFQNGEVRPGEILTSTFKWMQLIIVLFGFLSGYGIIAGLLSYDGRQPTNVSIYILVVILYQIIILISIPLTALYLKHLKSHDIYHLSILGEKLIGLVIGLVLKATISNIKHKVNLKIIQLKKYDRIVLLKSTVLIQWFGLSFNFSLVSVFALFILFSDRAFGWQTSANLIDTNLVYSICNGLALPWSWIWGDSIGFPSIEQIQGTQIFLHQSISSIDPKYLHAWWPFLILATITYGLLPRVILYLITINQLKQCLKDPITESDVKTNRLHSRMTTQRVSTRTENPIWKRTEYTNHQIDNIGFTKKEFHNVILTSIDLKSLGLNKKSEQIIQLFGNEISEMFYFGNSKKEDQIIESFLRESAHYNLLLIDQDWNPPTAQDIERIKKFLEVTNSKNILRIVLTGIPLDDVLTPANQYNLKHWEKEICKIRSDRITVESIQETA